MKLSDFANSKENIEEKLDETVKESLNEKYDELKDLSHDELLSRLTKEIKRQKETGEFNYEALISSLNAIKMYLPVETYDNMIRIIDEINGKD